jgi:hypothetical protein
LFFGNVTINNLPATVGSSITAVPNEEPVYITAEAGFYGSTELTGTKFKVQGEIENGDPITFFVNGVQAEVRDMTTGGPWLDSYPFNAGGQTNLDLNASGTPQYRITATAGPHGSIVPSGIVYVEEGDDQSFTIIPANGYTIDELLIDSVSQSAVTFYTFTNVTEDHTISVTFREGAPDYFTVQLGDGWNLFSTPIKLASGHKYFEEIFLPDSLDQIEVVLGWDGTEWFIPGYGYELKPLDAVYIKVEGSATAHLYPYTGLSSPPLRVLGEGLNLIGPAQAYESGGFPNMTVEQSLVSVYVVPPGDLTGYTIVVSPSLNQPGWTYTREGPSQVVLPYKGYWVIMENPGTLAGFSTTPII